MKTHPKQLSHTSTLENHYNNIILTQSPCQYSEESTGAAGFASSFFLPPKTLKADGDFNATLLVKPSPLILDRRVLKALVRDKFNKARKAMRSTDKACILERI